MLCIYDIIVHVAVVARMTYEYPITLTELIAAIFQSRVRALIESHLSSESRKSG